VGRSGLVALFDARYVLALRFCESSPEKLTRVATRLLKQEAASAVLKPNSITLAGS